MSLPQLRIKKHHEIRAVRGHPWIFSNEIENFSELKTLEKGSLVEVKIRKDESFAIAYFNPHSLIAARIITYKTTEQIDENFFLQRLTDAKNLREKFFTKPFYRLIHSEADFLPGLVIDRFGDVLSCQISTAGMEKLSPILISALEKIFPNSAIIFRNDIETRKLEGLVPTTKIIKGEIADQIEIEENGIKFLIDVKSGQKTGWFFDQRKNREFVARIAKDCDVLDAFCYLGGFGFNALKGGAKSVTFVDSSPINLSLPQNCEFINEKIFALFEKTEFQQRRFDLVLLDPPAFIKSKKDFFSGLKGYEKLVRLAAKLVHENGILMLSSCSHHATLQDLTAAANDGFRKANRQAKLIRVFGADVDHPIHPALKENEYLK
ncbi:MAG: class I SAM-dependent rRNA methyltransferase, partial [Alphaproteobacteria bacterium]|nr:class I SAM-dependent rRNA methyltransferase [Alphaproteobacteria bacterium]